MKVIFLQDIPNVGRAGDVKDVKNGHARNYLIPRGLAAPATPAQLQRGQAIKKASEERRLKEEQDMNVLAQTLSEIVVTVKAKVGPTGRFYGSVTSTHISEELSTILERPIDRRNIHMEEPIHEPGQYQLEVRLYPGINATLNVVAEAEAEQE